MESLPPLEVIEILDSSTEEDEDDDNNNIGVWDRGTLRDEEPKPQRIRQRNGGFVSTARCVPQINDSLIVGKQIDFETHGGPNMLTTKTELNSLNRRKDNQNDDGRSSGDADIENKHDSVHRNSATAMDEISEPVADVGMAETTSTDVTMTTFTLSSIQTKMVLQGVSSSQSEIDVNSRDSAMNRPAAVARKPGSLHKDVPRDKRPETTDLIFNEVHGGDNRGCGVLLSQQQTLQQPTCLRPRDKNASDSARYNNHGDGTGNPAAHFSLCLPILSTERTAKEAPHLPTDGESACLLLNGAATVPSVETHDLQREKRVTLTRTALNDAQIAEKSTCIPPTATNIKEAGVANMVSSIGKRNIQGGANGSSGDLRRHLSSGILPLPNSPAKEGLTGLQPAPAARCLEGQAPADGITTRTEVTCSVQQNMLLMEERERKQFERILHTTSQGQATCSISTKHQRKTAFKSTMGGSVITGRNVAPKIDKTALSSRKRSREDVGFVSQSNKRTCAIGESEIQEEPRVIAHIAAHNDNCDDPVNQRSIGGVSSSSSQTSQPVYLPAAHDSSVDGSLTSSLVNRRKQMCGECPGCIAPCCGKCVLCARRRGADTPRSSCIFRICKDHSVKTKAYRQSQVKKLFCESQPRITNEAKPIRRAFACDVTATNISFSTEESRPEVSNYENTDDTTRKTIGWWAGNGISHDRAVAFLRKISNPKRCDTCSACVTVNCGKCGMCQLGHSDACIIRCCGSAGSVTEAFYIEEINLMLGGRVNRCLCEGTKVYCRWPTNNTWYWGKIRKAYRGSNRQLRFTIEYDDNTSRAHTPEKDIRDEFELKLDRELSRLLGNEVGVKKSAYGSSQLGNEDIPGCSEIGRDPMNSDPGFSVNTAGAESTTLAPHGCACGSCQNCTKANCGKCCVCRKDPERSRYLSHDSICVQKMCVKLQAPQNAQRAPGLPYGWKFTFVDPKKDHPLMKSFQGLRLVAPMGQTFRSLESASSVSDFSCSNAEVFHEFVGLTDVVDVEKNPKVVSDKKEVSEACYALFTNGCYYLGTIEKVSGKGDYRTFDVRFDDGDFLAGVANNQVYTENDYVMSFGPIARDSKSLTSHEIFARRCRNCSMCRKDDCGKCSSCKSNRTTTTIQRQVCWHKMCLNIPTHQKVQPLPGLLNVDCKFYFTDESSYANLDHSANGLRIIAGGKEYDCIRPAMLACGIEGESLNNTITQFFDKQLGLKLRRLLPRHPLTNGGYFLEWSDVNGGRKVIRGTITHAWESLEGQGRSFTVRYDDGLRDAAQYTPGCGCRIPAFDENVQEQMAWGGYVAFLRKAQPFAGRLEVFTVKPQIPFHWQWIVPEVRLELAEVSATLAALDCNIPRLVMFVDGSKLVFQANKSSIEGAGLGLWVTCKTERGLQLAPGCFLDLGKYAPLRNEDRKSDNLCLLKNFLYAWNGEGWSFDTAPHEQDMQFDITDDGTGELHRLAKFNPLVYANETDGKKEVPSLRAFYDPEGCVHYLMGHQERCQGPLQLPFNEPVELKIDYGECYEKVRVRKNYSRLEFKDKHKMLKEIEQDDNDMVQEFCHYSANDTDEVLCFLEGLFSKGWSPSCVVLQRTLIVALALLARIKAIQLEFKDVNALESASDICDCGYSEMGNNNLANRLRGLVAKVCVCLKGNNNENRKLKESVLSMKLLLAVVACSLACDAGALRMMPDAEMLAQILAL